MKVDVNGALVLHYVILRYAAWSYCDSPNNTPPKNNCNQTSLFSTEYRIVAFKIITLTK